MLAMFFESVYSDSGESFLGVFDSKETGINTYLSYKNIICKNDGVVYNISKSCDGIYKVYYIQDEDTIIEGYITFKSLVMNKIVDLDSF